MPGPLGTPGDRSADMSADLNALRGLIANRDVPLTRPLRVCEKPPRTIQMKSCIDSPGWSS